MGNNTSAENEMSEELEDDVLDIEDEEVEDTEEVSDDKNPKKESKKGSKKTSKSSSVVSQKFCETIKDYLDNFAKENQFFAEKYSNPKKNINECCNFIVSEVRKMVRKMNVQGLADDEVYYLARHYYEEEDLKVDSVSGLKVVVNHQIELTEDEKKAAHEKALKDYEVAERQRIEKEAKAKAEKEAKAIERARIKAQQKAEKEKAESKQLSLFDLLGE